MTFPTLDYFAESEFRHPELMDHDFLRWLNRVRWHAGIPFHLTSDARTPEHNARVGGSPHSLHLQGRAVDFVVRPWTVGNLWRVVEAVMLRPPTGTNGAGVELELVQSERDKHIHLGWYPDDRPSRLILALD